MPQKKKEQAEKKHKKEEKKPAEKKIEPRIKEVKKEEKTEQEENREGLEFANEDFLGEQLRESIGRALPILRSGMVQEKIDNLEEFADILPSSDSEEKDKGYITKTGYADSYTSGKKYEVTDTKKGYDTAESFAEAKREIERKEEPVSLAQERKSSFTEKESKESLDTFARQQQRYETRREEESSQPVFRHKEKKE